MHEELNQKLEKLLNDFQFPEIKKFFDTLPEEKKKEVVVKKWKKVERIIHNTNTRKVDFCVVGAQKAGTTSLNHYLRQHDKVCVSPLKKELHYFERADRVAHEWYNRCFFPDESTQLIGEASPTYMFFKEIPERMFKYNPKMKLLCILREPVSRLLSQWNMNVDRYDRYKNRRFSIQEVIEDYMRNLDRGMVKMPGFIQRGMYADQLDRLNQFFPKEQILLIKSENLKKNTQGELNRIFDFLGLEHQEVELEHRHVRSYSSSVSDEVRAFLRGIFFHSNYRLSRKYNFDISGW